MEDRNVMLQVKTCIGSFSWHRKRITKDVFGTARKKATKPKRKRKRKSVTGQSSGGK